MFLRRHDRSDRQYCSSKCRMRALRQRRGDHAGRRPRGRPARHPIPHALSRAALQRVAARDRLRAEQAERDASDLQRRFDEQSRELEEARARIAELERLLAEAQGEHGDPETDSEQPEDERPPNGNPGGASDGPTSRPRPASPRPGIMEVRRQLSQALAGNAELRALVEELQQRIATLERRCTALERELGRALALAEQREPPAAGQLWDADSAARVQERAALLATELEQARRERSEAAEQRDRLLSRIAGLTLADVGAAVAPSTDYSAARTELFEQVRIELEVRDRFARWESERRQREGDRRLDPTRTHDEQALVATLALRWQLMDHAPQSFRQRRRWAIEGLVLDPASERFLLRQSRERVTYRERMLAGAGSVT